MPNSNRSDVTVARSAPADAGAAADIREGLLSPFAYGAAFIALAALALTARGLPLLGAFALAILLSRITPYRLRDHTFLRWLLRILLIAVVWILTPDTNSFGGEAMGTPHARNLFGEICAAEMTLQFWRFRSYDPRRSNLTLLLMTGMTFLTASNIYDGPHIRLLTPLFLLCVGFMARDYRVRRPSAFTLRLDRETWARRRPPLFPLLLRGIAFAVALGVGLASYTVTVANKGALTDFGNKVLFKSSWEVDMGGMSAQPELGSAFGLRGSPARVLRLENFSGDAHLDGVSYTDYDRGHWGPIAAQLPWHNASEIDLHPVRSRAVDAASTNAVVTRLVSDNPLLYLPLNTAAIDVGTETHDVARGTPDGGPFRVRASAPYDYTLSIPDRERFQGLLAQPLTDPQRQHYLALSDDLRAKLLPLSTQITAHARDTSTKIADVVGYLISHHKYSLEYRQGKRDVDPIVDFLLSAPPKAAHCEFFATAACVLLREAGVPTRYVTGYYAHESEGAGKTIVRQRDAHAWCEAWLEGTGWVTVDATPGDGKPDELAALTPVEPWRRVYEWFQDHVQALTADLANITPLQLGLGLTAASVAALGGWIGWTMLRRRRLTAASTANRGQHYTLSDPTLGELAERFEAAWLARTKRTLPTQQTYSEYLRALPRLSDRVGDMGETRTDEAAVPPVSPALIAAASAFAQAYETLRFGGPAALDADRRADMRQRLEQIEKNTPE